MFRPSVPLLLAVTLVLLLAAGSRAQVVETRRSEGNPMIDVFKSTLYGGAAGLVLGLAVELVDDDDDNSDAPKWGFVTGTFFGFGYGLYYVTTRSRPEGLLRRDAGGWSIGVPSVEPAATPGVRIHLSTVRF